MRLSRKVLLTLVAISLIVVTVIAVILSRDEGVEIKNVTSLPKTATVEIDFKSYESVYTTGEKTRVNNLVAKYISQLNKSGQIAATTRDGSLEKQTLDGFLPVKRVVIDIPSIKNSFLVTVNGDEGVYSDYYSVIIECAPKELQIDQSVECKDIHEGEGQ